MKKVFVINFILPFLLGLTIWHTSPKITGKIEPWDSGGLYYLISLILIGVITGALNKNNFSLLNILLSYLGLVLGQIFFLSYFLPNPPSQYFGVGVGFICFYSLIPLGSYILVSYLKSKMVSEY